MNDIKTIVEAKGWNLCVDSHEDIENLKDMLSYIVLDDDSETIAIEPYDTTEDSVVMPSDVALRLIHAAFYKGFNYGMREKERIMHRDLHGLLGIDRIIKTLHDIELKLS